MEIKRRVSKEYAKIRYQQKQRKQRLKQLLQQQLLSNYYMSKYQNHMAKLTNQSGIDRLQQRASVKYDSLSRGSSSLTPNKKIKNFKHLIIDKKNAKKNFKHEVSKRNSKQKQKHVKFQMFDSIKASLNQELQSKMPSKIQSGQFYSVQIMSKTIPVYNNRNLSPTNANNRNYQKNQSYYSHNSSRLQNSFIVPQLQENIEIRESNQFQQDSFDQYGQEKQDLWREQNAQQIKLIQSGIRKKFEKRLQKNKDNSKHSSPNRSRVSSPESARKRYQSAYSNQNRNNSLSKNQQFPNNSKYLYPASPINNSRSSYSKQKGSEKIASPASSQQSFRNKKSFLQSGKKSPKASQQIKRPSLNSSQIQPIQLINQYQNQMKQNQRFSFLRGNQDSQLSFSRTSSLQNQQNNKKMKNSQINQNVLSNLDELRKPQEHMSLVLDEQIRRNYLLPQDQPSIQLRESTHDLSNISRFSMTSEQGSAIKQNLCRQIDQNQFGPYQNALADLRDLIEQYPNAWPIFVVGQRMLQDRKQYQTRKKNQTKQLNELKSKIDRKNKEKVQLQYRRKSKVVHLEIAKNQHKIQQLIRTLAQRI